MVFSLKCWIRIRMKLMRIRNPGKIREKKGKPSAYQQEVRNFRTEFVESVLLQVARIRNLKNDFAPVYFTIMF
jgi:hypothetical protein